MRPLFVSLHGSAKTKFMNPTLDDIKSLAAFAKANAIQPRVVKDKREARRMRKDDPSGYRWVAGEKYYILETVNGRSFWKP